MRFDKVFSALGPAMALAMSAGLSGCGGGSFSVNDKNGVPLSELDLSGQAPDTLKLIGPDILRVSSGDTLAITLEGDEDATQRVRFLLKDDTLSVLRDGWDWSGTRPATVNITMPAPDTIVLAGSGEIHAAALADEAEVTIAGSGDVETRNISVTSLEVSIAGSGTYRASGSAKELDLSIAGAGDADMAGLRVDKADVSIAGSGNSNFSSDGTVDVSILGSGNVTVRGTARCTLSSAGSGTLTCENIDTAE